MKQNKNKTLDFRRAAVLIFVKLLIIVEYKLWYNVGVQK